MTDDCHHYHQQCKNLDNILTCLMLRAVYPAYKVTLHYKLLQLVLPLKQTGTLVIKLGKFCGPVLTLPAIVI